MTKVPDLSPPIGDVAAAEVLARRWFPGGARAEPLPPGFSGSPLFLLRPRDAEPHVLKACAASTGVGRARWIHALVGHLRSEGVAAVPAVRPLAGGGTVAIAAEGRLWEAVAFVAGEPVAEPGPPQIAAAMRTLAAIHAAAAALPGQPPALAVSRGLADRVAHARRMLDAPWRAVLARRPPLGGHPAGALRERLAHAAACFAAADGEETVRRLARLEPVPLPCQVVLRDVWSPHVLFAPDAPHRVAGVIDLHAAGFDTPATDVARLLGSWQPTTPAVEPGWWQAAVAAYETARPLGPGADRLVRLLAVGGVLFGLDNWFRWTLVEGRAFPCPDRAIARVDELLARLPAALQSLAELGTVPGLTGEKCSS